MIGGHIASMMSLDLRCPSVSEGTTPHHHKGLNTHCKQCDLFSLASFHNKQASTSGKLAGILTSSVAFGRLAVDA
jgi:hypothetical protein